VCLTRIDVVCFDKQYFALKIRLVKRLLYLGVPMLLQNVIISVGGLAVQFVINGFGIVFVAATTATGRLYSLLETAGISYGYAITTYVGQNLGAKNIKRIVKGIKWGNIVAISTSVIIALCLLIFGEAVLSMFIKTGSKDFALTLEYAYKYLAVMCCCLPVLYILHVYRSALSGLGNSTIPMYSGVAELVMRVCAASLLPYLFGKVHLFWAEPIAWLGATIVLVAGYYWKFAKVRKKFQC
jgi:Na+-driven multidrug efflux pump